MDTRGKKNGILLKALVILIAILLATILIFTYTDRKPYNVHAERKTISKNAMKTVFEVIHSSPTTVESVVRQRIWDILPPDDLPPDVLPPKPQNPIPKLQTPNPKLQTPIPKPQTPIPKPQAPNPKPQTPNPGSKMPGDKMSGGKMSGYLRQHIMADNSTKIIYLYTRFWTYFDKDFTECPIYNNCKAVQGYDSSNEEKLEQATLVMMHDSFLKNSRRYQFPGVRPETRAKQLWILKTIESPGYSMNRYPGSLNGKINMTISYRRGSDIVKSYHPEKILSVPQVLKPKKGRISFKMYTKGKTKGAFVYVSNCVTYHYSRLGVMEELKNYIDVDIFGKCGPLQSSPCRQGDFQCEAEVHKQYHFFLSFENTLCEDYITEKFWQRLKNPSFLLPVAMGGLTLEDYTSKAPKDSFLHLYNFTSVPELGKYMRHLMDNPEEYAKYHRWRESQSFVIDARLPACRLCELAFTLPEKPARTDLTNWWNDPKVCRKYP